MRQGLFALLMVVPALAGCIGNDVVEDRVDGVLDPALPREIDWSLDGCKAVVALVHVAKEKLQPHVPEGWRVQAPEEQGGPKDPRGDAVLGVEVFECASASVSNHTDNASMVERATYGSYWTFVEPPAEKKRDDVMFHFWKWDTVVADDTLREVLRAEGLPAKTGQADMDADDGSISAFLESPQGPNAFTVGLSWEEGTIGFWGVAGAPFESKKFSFVEYQAAQDGRIASWYTDVVGEQVNIGAGYVKFSEGTWGREVTGQERAPAYFFAAKWSFTNGKLVIPAAVTNTTLPAQ